LRIKQFILDNGKINKEVGEEYKSEKMAQYMKVIGKTIWLMDMEDFGTLMVIFIKVNG